MVEIKKINGNTLCDEVARTAADAAQETAEEAKATAAVQADMNCNDPDDPAYIQNRTHYTILHENEVLVENATVVVEEGNTWDAGDSITADLVEGGVYDVTLNGETYSCECKDDGYGGLYIGSHDLWNNNELEEYDMPFCYGYYKGQTRWFAASTPGTYTVSITGTWKTVKQLDEKYIRDAIALCKKYECYVLYDIFFTVSGYLTIQDLFDDISEEGGVPEGIERSVQETILREYDESYGRIACCVRAFIVCDGVIMDYTEGVGIVDAGYRNLVHDVHFPTHTATLGYGADGNFYFKKNYELYTAGSGINISDAGEISTVEDVARVNRYKFGAYTGYKAIAHGGGVCLFRSVEGVTATSDFRSYKNTDLNIGEPKTAYGNGKFVTLNYSNGNVKIYTSNDGVSWEKEAATGLDIFNNMVGLFAYMESIGKFMVVGTSSAYGTYTATSEDGITWESKKENIYEYMRFCAYAGGHLVGTDKSGYAVYYNGSEFVTTEYTITGPVVYDNVQNRLLSIDSKMSSSDGGATWVSVETTVPPIYGNGNYRYCAFLNGKYMIWDYEEDDSDKHPVLWTSDDAIEWESVIATGIPVVCDYIDGLYVGTLRNGSICISKDGATWNVDENLMTANGETAVQSYFFLESSTLGSQKKFKITVDDTGTLTATEVME